MAHTKRNKLLVELAKVGRENSDATVIFHAHVSRLMGLHATDYKALGILERVGPLSAGEIAAHTGLATASVTNLLDRLEERGFIRRIADPNDRRRAIAQPVPEKLEEARHVLASTSRSVKRMYDKYTNAELAVIADFLARNAGRLREETARLESKGASSNG